MIFFSYYDEESAGVGGVYSSNPSLVNKNKKKKKKKRSNKSKNL